MVEQIWDHPTLGRIRFTWFDEYTGQQPLTQSYGVCVTGNMVAIGSQKGSAKQWNLCGGTPEDDETPQETLIREADEELSLDIDVKQCLGVQKVEFLDCDEKTRYQIRYLCHIKNIKPLTPDPDNGILWKRKFVPLKQLNRYLEWGEIGDIIVEKAMKTNSQP